jgi:hypothetical protein
MPTQAGFIRSRCFVATCSALCVEGLGPRSLCRFGLGRGRPVGVGALITEDLPLGIFG